MNAVNILVRQQFPEVFGLQSTYHAPVFSESKQHWTCPMPFKSVPDGLSSAQIHHNGRDHWVLTVRPSATNDIFFIDSLLHKNSINPSLEVQMAQIYGKQKKSIKLSSRVSKRNEGVGRPCVQQMVPSEIDLLCPCGMPNVYDDMVGCDGRHCSCWLVSQKLCRPGVENDKIQGILEAVGGAGIFLRSMNGPLRSEQTRKTYYENKFPSLRPRPIYLGHDDENSARYAQYIPIKESIKFLYDSYPAFINLHNVPEACTAVNEMPEILRDVKDGTVFRSNALFQQESFQIILYQDAFEVVNPLGSARKKHKVVGVYFTLANIDSHLRSSVDHMQLVMLFTESALQFGQDKVFSRLVKYLQSLETTGIKVKTVEGEKNIQGTVCAIVGDNLGSHGIGGFVESFRHQYFCRFCTLDLDSFRETPYKLGTRRSLTHFLVANPGLPPCLGRDLFEGVMSYDMPLIIHNLVNKKWFSYDKLNSRIFNLVLSGTDSLDRPGGVTRNNDRLIGDLVKDTNDEVWQLYLKSIVELVCAPAIAQGQIVFLASLIEGYIDYRATIFPNINLRPKYHFLCHYPELIVRFGPLIRLWTMRFESKHSYFKKCARGLHNFKNLPKSLAKRHQLLQAFYSAGCLFPAAFQIKHSIDFKLDILDGHIKTAIVGQHFSHSNTVMANSVVFRGTEFKKDQALLLEKNEDGFLVGKIILILVKEMTVLFVVQTYQFISVPTFGLLICHESSQSVKSSKCVNLGHIPSYTPLSIYKLGQDWGISLKHTVPT
ncbi:uncharacterized protein LOC143036354 [Oratosquilla oratoria]|uniref:uncharacterized protein LOC143036354 n=1 Tax=Oratosquilla oratoria TaxID=337810 RepID=UPI003F76842E